MATVAPETAITGYEYVTAGGTVTADSMVIPLAYATGITAGDADPTTGSFNAILASLVQEFHNSIDSLDDASKPTNITTQSSTPNDSVAIDDSEANLTTTVTFRSNYTRTLGAATLAAEA